MPTTPVLTRRSALGGALAAAAIGASTPLLAQSDALKSLVAAAKAEGAVVVDGPPNDVVRELITAGFMRDYGIPVSYISSGSAASGARVRAERAAGKYLLDVFVTGSDTPTITMLPAGWLDKVEPALVAPDVVDKRRWRDGHLWYMDEGHTILRVLQYVTPLIAVNTKLVKPGEPKTWRSLLEPQWHGKLLARDPGSTGSGGSLIAMLYITFGADFVKKLYLEQKPVLSTDPRQGAQFLAEGEYAVFLGPDPASIDQFQRAGYPVSPAFPTDAPSITTGGFGVVCLMNKAPHPNAAKLFINWLAGQKMQGPYADALLSVSLRNDVTYTHVPPWMFPKKGVKYLDTYDYTFVTKERDEARNKARDLLGE